MAIVKTENKKRFPYGVESILPVVGKVKVGEDGTLDVADHHLDSFLEVTDFYVVKEDDDEEQLKEKSEGDELNEGEEEIDSDDEDDEVTLSQEEKATIVASLPSLKRTELQAYCQSYPSKEWRLLDKEGLVKYLTEKLA